MYFKFFQAKSRQVLVGLNDAEDVSDSTDSVITPAATENKFKNYAYRQLRLVRPTQSLQDLLEKILRNAENAGPKSCEIYLEQMLIFLKANPQLVNCVPNKFHSNPLELAIKLGIRNCIKELLHLKAEVRPQNRFLLNRIKPLLTNQKNSRLGLFA
jgi:hypothetical protein